MKGNKRETKGKWKWKWKGKLSDPSPFINILNKIQFLLVVVGIKHSYLQVGMEEREFWLVYVYEKGSERK